MPPKKLKSVTVSPMSIMLLPKKPEPLPTPENINAIGKVIIEAYKVSHSLIELQVGDIVNLDHRVTSRAAEGKWTIVAIFAGKYLRVKRTHGDEVRQVTIEAVTGWMLPKGRRLRIVDEHAQAKMTWEGDYQDPSRKSRQHREIEL